VLRFQSSAVFALSREGDKQGKMIGEWGVAKRDGKGGTFPQSSWNSFGAREFHSLLTSLSILAVKIRRSAVNFSTSG